MTADPSTIAHSPDSPLPADGGLNNQQRSLPSPWAQVVRVGGSESILAVSSSPPIAAPDSLAPAAVKGLEEARESLHGTDSNAGRPKKPAWNKPLNGVLEATTTPVMGAVSWPALSDAIGTTPKSSSDSSKPISDGSVSVSQGPVVSHSFQKQHNTNAAAKPNFTPNHTMPGRQRNSKRGGGGSTHSGFPRPLPPHAQSMPPPFPFFELPYGSMVPPVFDAAGREPHHKNSNWESRPPVGGAGSQHGVNDHPSLRSSSRKGKFGLRPVGEGPYHNGYAGRRDQDRDAQGSSIRDVHLPRQVGPLPPKGLTRQPSRGSGPYIAPQPVRPFGNPMRFDMASPFLYVPPLPHNFTGVPLLAHVPPPLYPFMDPPLPSLLINQIDYYFSDANLVKDNFLRSNMDDQGWVPITLIASFPRVQFLTNNIQLILDSLRGSAVVELQGDKVRRRNEWRKWIPRFPTASGSQSPIGLSDDKLVTSFQKVTLGDITMNHNNISITEDHTGEGEGRYSPEDLVGLSKLANGEDAAEEVRSTEK